MIVTQGEQLKQNTAVALLQADAAKAANLASWETRFEAAKERCQNAIDAEAPHERILKLALEARSCELDLESVRRFGRPMNRAERRERGMATSIPNGYRAPA